MVSHKTGFPNMQVKLKHCTLRERTELNYGFYSRQLLGTWFLIYQLEAFSNQWIWLHFSYWLHNWYPGLKVILYIQKIYYGRAYGSKTNTKIFIFFTIHFLHYRHILFNTFFIYDISSWILLNSNYNITLSFICLEIIQKSKN